MEVEPFLASHKGDGRISGPKYQHRAIGSGVTKGSVAAIVSLSLLALGIGLIVTFQTSEVTLIAANGLILVIPLLWRFSRGRIDLFEPLTLFILAWAILFFVRPIAMLQANSFEILTYPIRQGFIPMLLMAFIGSSAFLIGYASPLGLRVGRSAKPLPAEWHVHKIVTYAIALTIIGLVLFAAFIIPSGGLDFLRSLLAGRQDGQRAQYQLSTAYFYNAIVVTFPAALLVIAAGAVKRRVGTVLLGVGILGLVLAEVAPGGYRGWLIPIIAAPFILLYLRRATRPSFMVIAVVSLLALPTLTFVENARNVGVRTSVGTVQLLTDEFGHLTAAWNMFILGGDTEMTSLLSLEAITVPNDIPFQHGVATGELLVHPIPRQIWPDKPRPGDEALTRTLFADKGIDFASRTYTPMGNFYLDFGFWGVFIGMALLGVVGRAHYEFLLSNARNFGVQLFYAATVPFWIVLLRDSVTDTVARLLFIIPPLIVGLYLARARPTQGSSVVSRSSTHPMHAEHHPGA